MNKSAQSIISNVTNNKYEIWKTVKLTSFQKRQLQSVLIFFKFVHPCLLFYLLSYLYLFWCFEPLFLWLLNLLINFATKLLLVTSFSKLDPGFQFYADHTSQTVKAKLCKLFCNVALTLPVNLRLESIKTYGFSIFSFLVSLCFI